MSFLFRKSAEPPGADTALPGRDTPIPVVARYLVLDTPITPPFPQGFEQVASGWAASGAQSGALDSSARGSAKRPGGIRDGVSWFGSWLIDRAEAAAFVEGAVK